MFENLTERQKQMMFFIGAGWENERIARQLKIRENTVAAHVAALSQKIKARNRIHIVMIYRRSLLRLEPWYRSRGTDEASARPR